MRNHCFNFADSLLTYLKSWYNRFMPYIIDNLRNSFDFFLRNRITFSRKNYYEKPQNLSGIFTNEEQENLYAALENKYGDLLSQNTNKRNFLLNIYFLNIFDKYLTPKNSSPKENISILDIGSKNWAYVKSEYVFFKSFTKDFTLNGIELDAYRMYSNFYNRYEIAKFYTKDLPNTNYIPGDLLEHQQKYDYIIWILPFITEYPLVKWGLPLKYFKPEDMLIHAYNLLKPEGEMLIINQGEEEYLIQQELVNKTILESKYLPHKYLPLGLTEDPFGIFKHKRYCSKLIKQ